MDPEMTENAQRVYETLTTNDVLPLLLRWVLATAVNMTEDVDGLTLEELQSIYEKLREDAIVPLGGFR